MSELINKLVASASALNKTIVLTEGEDSRVVVAAAEIVKRKIAKIVLLGDEAQIKADNPGVDLTGVQIINPKTSPKLKEYTELL